MRSSMNEFLKGVFGYYNSLIQTRVNSISMNNVDWTVTGFTVQNPEDVRKKMQEYCDARVAIANNQILEEVKSIVESDVGPIIVRLLRQTSGYKKLSTERTWHEFGTKDSLGGEDFMQTFEKTFIENGSARFKMKKIGKGFNAMTIIYPNYILLKKNTTINETEGTKDPLVVSWYFDWFVKDKPSKPSSLKNYVYVHSNIPEYIKGIEHMSRTGRGMMVNKSAFTRTGLFKKKGTRGIKTRGTRGRVPAYVMEQVNSGGWRFRSTPQEKEFIEEVLRSKDLFSKMSRIIVKSYKNLLYKYLRD